MRGVLMIAHDNGLFDYGTMTYLAACMVRYHLSDPPICLVTDERTWESLLQKYPMAEGLFMDPIITEHPEVEDNVRKFRVDGEIKSEKYLNHTRLQAYDLSPFDETLMIDSDVMVLDDRLKLCWGSKNEMMINRNVGKLRNPISVKPHAYRVNDISLNVLWATITYFKRTERVATFFELAKYIMKNFSYYGMLYKFPVSLYRNDYAFTVASHIMSGYLGGGYEFVQPLPVPYTTFAWEDDKLMDVERGKAVFNLTSHDFPVVTRNTVHCMNKKSMVDNADRILAHYA